MAKKLPPDATPMRDSTVRLSLDKRRIMGGRPASGFTPSDLQQVMHSEAVHSPQKGDIDLPSGFTRTANKNAKK